MANLLDSFKHYITPEIIGAAAQMLGENENGISKAMGSLVPAILFGMQEKSSDAGVMSDIFNKVSQFDAGVLERLGSLLGSGNLAHHDPKDVAGHLLGHVLGSKVPAMTNAVAAFSGVKSSSASVLLGLVGPMILGLLSKKIRTGNLNLTGFVNLLAAEKNNVLNLLPAGVGAVLGLPGVQINAGNTSTNGSDTPSGSGWLLPLLLLLGLGLGIVYCMKN